MDFIDLNEELSPIDPEDPRYARMLANLQGNILKSHGRNEAVHLFLTFPAEDEKIVAVRHWISDFTARYITSAMRQHYETKEFKINEISGRIFAGFYLSAAGYRKLGFTDADLNKFVEENLSSEDQEEFNNTADIEISFREGMAASQNELRDLPCTEWEDSFLLAEDKKKPKPIHALILLADNDESRLKDVTNLISKKLGDLDIDFFIQEGLVLREQKNGDTEIKPPIEPFGFRDGVSQPVFYQADVKETRENGYREWDSFAPLKLVLVEDPLTDEKDCFGSYLVYRKLEQNVKGFNDKRDELASALTKKTTQELTDDEKDLAGALVVGRFKNGVPVMLSSTKDNDKLKDFNNFNFIDKDTGTSTTSKCPYHAHIRRMNPRGESGDVEREATRRIVRRGITYSEQNGNVGLLFMCFQRSIPKQFGFIQTKWANTTTFFRHTLSGLDPITGQIGVDPATGKMKKLETFEWQKWCPVWGSDDEEKIPFEFENFVTLKGGEYFFAPSIAFLRGLKPLENQQ